MILIGVFVVATGRGGELAYEHADHAPLDLGVISPTDVALLRPPTALWGYNMQVTDEAMDRIARAVRDRDIEIAFLRRKLADLGQPVIGEPFSWPVPVETASVEIPPVGTPPVGTPPVGTPAVGTPAVGTPPVGTPPVGTPETPPVDTPPLDQTRVDIPAVVETEAAAGAETVSGDRSASGESPDDDTIAAAEEQGW